MSLPTNFFIGRGGTGVGGPKSIVGYDQQYWPPGNVNPTSYFSYPANTQAGDLAIIFFGFSGYDSSGAAATNSVTITSGGSSSGWTETSGTWGATSGTPNYYANTIFYKKLTSADISTGYRFSTTDSNMEVYSLWSTVVVRNPHSTIYTDHGAYFRNGSYTNDTTYEETFGTVPASGSRVSAADNGILIYAITDRWGTISAYENITGPYSGYNILGYNYDSGGNVFVQALYTASQADQDLHPDDAIRGRFRAVGSTYSASYSLISV